MGWGSWISSLLLVVFYRVDSVRDCRHLIYYCTIVYSHHSSPLKIRQYQKSGIVILIYLLQLNPIVQLPWHVPAKRIYWLQAYLGQCHIISPTLHAVRVHTLVFWHNFD